MKPIATTYTQPPKEYYIVFTQGTHWIAKILRPNFSHIYLLTRDDYNWLLLNPTRLHLQAEVLPIAANDDAPRKMADPLDTILRVTFGERDTLRRYGTLGLFNCVTWSKYMLGLNVRALTPYQLYKTLINFNAKQMAAYGIHSIRRM